MRYTLLKKSMLFTAALLASTAIFAACPQDPYKECPALGSSLSEALTCKWSIPTLSPDDPLTQLIVAGTPIPVGPKINRDGTPVCMYANSSFGTPTAAPLMYKPQNK